MTPPNENGVYEAEVVEELARRGRSYARVEIARCRDGFYRFAIDAMFSDRGFGGLITDRGTGFPSCRRQGRGRRGNAEALSAMDGH